MSEAIAHDYAAVCERMRQSVGDEAAIRSLLAGDPDLTDWWLPRAYEQLRVQLAAGKLADGAETAELIRILLYVRDPADGNELADHRIHAEAAARLVDGISAVVDREHDVGLPLLQRVTEATYCHEALQWLGWHWISRAFGDTGELDRAVAAAQSAAQLGKPALAASLSARGELRFHNGQVSEALDDLAEAIHLYEQTSDAEGTSMALLTRAQMLSANGDVPEAIECATRARQANPKWERPVVFLARQALVEGHYDEAKWVLQLYYDKESASPEVARELHLVELGRKGIVRPEILSRYSELRNMPPSEQTIQALRMLLAQAPHFTQLRELLAWTLFKRGHDEEATTQFEELAIEDLDPETHASVLLGLGCLANRRNRHRQVGARVHAARMADKGLPHAGSAAKPPPPPIPVDELKELNEDGMAPLEMMPDEASDQNITEFDVVSSLHRRSGLIRAPASQPRPPDPRRTSAPKVTFTGDLEILAVPELMELLRTSRRTGALVITAQQGIGVLQFRRGQIVGGGSPSSPQIGKCLIDVGVIDEATLAEAAQKGRRTQPGRLLGAVLMDQGLVTKQQVEQALTRQMEHVLAELVTWTSGRFAFDPDDRDAESHSDIEVELDPQALLMEALSKLYADQGDEGDGTDGADDDPFTF